jgi:hypothetical protein
MSENSVWTSGSNTASEHLFSTAEEHYARFLTT